MHRAELPPHLGLEVAEHGHADALGLLDVLSETCIPVPCSWAWKYSASLVAPGSGVWLRVRRHGPAGLALYLLDQLFGRGSIRSGIAGRREVGRTLHEGPGGGRADAVLDDLRVLGRAD